MRMGVEILCGGKAKGLGAWLQFMTYTACGDSRPITSRAGLVVTSGPFRADPY